MEVLVTTPLEVVTTEIGLDLDHGIVLFIEEVVGEEEV